MPLYIDKKGSGDNILSRILWFILLNASWLAIIAAYLGYLSTTQVLLGRLEASVIIWFGLLVIYSFSCIGIDLVKIQWVIVALGVGLEFGLQGSLQISFQA